MSIVVLKRKTDAMKNLSGKSKRISNAWANQGPHGGKTPVSYGGGFSINGGHRNIGSVGTTNLAKSVKRTQFFGNTAQSNAGKTVGSNFSYHNSGSCCFNNNTVVKPSVLSTRGMLAKKHRWLSRGYPHYWVQPTVDNINSSANTYTEKVKANNMCQTTSTDSGKLTCDNKYRKPHFIGTRLQANTPYAKARDLFSRSQSDYLNSKKLKCLNPTDEQKPFPYQVNNSGCNKFVLRI
jgi:hypothetical protein